MTQTIETTKSAVTVSVRSAKSVKVATEAKANVDKIVALNANLLAAA